MKANKAIYWQLSLGLILACIYAFLKLETGNSYAFISAVKSFETNKNQNLQISLKNSQGSSIYIYNDSADFESNQRLINLLSESKILGSNRGADYCLNTSFANKEFSGCFAAEQINTNLPLGVLLKILSIKSK